MSAFNAEYDSAPAPNGSEGEPQAEAVFALVDENRDYLREWLPWLDNNRSVDDTRAFIKKSLEQMANNSPQEHDIASCARGNVEISQG